MSTHNLRISARTLVHLGAELITSNAIAINELIKNAFDARSETVEIHFDIPFNPVQAYEIADLVDSKKLTINRALTELKGTIATDLSEEKYDQLYWGFEELPRDIDKFSEKLRQLADTTCTIRVEDWGIGMSREDLLNSFLVIGTPDKFLKKQQRNGRSKALLGDKGIGRLAMMRLGRFAHVLSSTKECARYHYIDFDWQDFEDPLLYLDNVKLNVIADKSKKRVSSGTSITISGLKSSWTQNEIDEFITKFIRRLRDPFDKSRKRFPIKICFNGKYQPIPNIWNWFIESAEFRATYNFNPKNKNVVLRRRLQSKKSSAVDARDWHLAELCKVLSINEPVFKRLGPIEIGCYWFNRNKLKHPTGEREPKEIKQELDIWSGGFAQYRDGFRIGWTGSEENDWLRMSATALRGRGFRLNNIQTVGSVAFSSYSNPNLVDAANREGLIECPEYDALVSIMKNIVLKDLRYIIELDATVEEKKEIAEASSKQSMLRAKQAMKDTVDQLRQIRSQVPTDLKPKIGQLRDTLNEQIDYVKNIDNALKLAKESKVEILELASIGGSTEIVAHELVRATERISELLNDLTIVNDKAKLKKLIDSIQSQLKSVNKRLRSIDPLSPSGRQRKEKFDLNRYIHGLLEGYQPRFERHEIDAYVEIDEKESNKAVQVRLVKGFLGHIFENLLSNSVYWLKEGIGEPFESREIHIDIDQHGRAIEYWDTGPGIDPKHINDIFAPYFTRKKNGKGLGLFIARELTEYHGGKLYLSDAADDDGRLRLFVIELPDS